MKKIISALTVPLFFVSAYSQNSMQNEYKEWEPSQNEYINFDISKYITPDIVRNQLDINFNFNSYNLRTDYSESNRDNKYESSSYTGNISSYFSHYVNTRKKISSLTVDLSFGGNYYSYKDKQTNNLITIDEESSSYQLNPSLDLSWLNKWYFSKLIFLDYGINGTISYNFKQNKIKNQSEDSKQKDFSLNISPQVGIGYGRIENVQDARQAVYIADALSKRKVLTRNLSNDELFELSQIISTVKNKRFLDSRLHLIDEITSVDSFFVNNKLLTDNGVAYFTTLYDMWNYGALFSRKSGYEISFVVRPYYEYQNVKHTLITTDVINNLNLYIISLNFSYEKPSKLNWQHSLTVNVLGGIYSHSVDYKEINYENSSKGKAFSAFAGYTLGYYPNTRTNIQVSASQQISKNIYDNLGNSMESYTRINANLYYYFSPNLRLAAYYGLVYSPIRIKGNDGYYSNRNILSSSFNIQLNYFIF